MPKKCHSNVLRPLSDHDAVGETQETKNDIVVINLPSAADHDENSDGVDPVHDSHRRGMKATGRMRERYSGCFCHGRSSLLVQDARGAKRDRHELLLHIFLLFASRNPSTPEQWPSVLVIAREIPDILVSTMEALVKYGVFIASIAVAYGRAKPT
jgi:hypothetical protein